MSGGMSSVQTMISTLRNNSRLLKKSYYFEEARKELTHYHQSPHLQTKATPEQLEKIRQKLHKQIVRNRVDNIITLVVSLIITGVIAYLLIDWLIPLYFG